MFRSEDDDPIFDFGYGKKIPTYQRKHVEYHQPCAYQVVYDDRQNQNEQFWLAIKWGDYVLKASINPTISPHLYHHHRGQLKLFSGAFTKENFFDLSFWYTPRTLKIQFLTISEQDQMLAKHPVLNFETMTTLVYDADFALFSQNQANQLKQTYNLATNQNVVATFVAIVNPNHYQQEPDVVKFHFIDEHSVGQNLFSIKIFAFEDRYYQKHRQHLLTFAKATNDEQIIQTCQILHDLPPAILNRKRFDHLWILFEKFFAAKNTFQVDLIRRQYREKINYWINYKATNQYLKIQPFVNQDLINLDWKEIKRQLQIQTKKSNS